MKYIIPQNKSIPIFVFVYYLLNTLLVLIDLPIIQNIELFTWKKRKNNYREYMIIPIIITDNPNNFCLVIFSFKNIQLNITPKTYPDDYRICPNERGITVYAQRSKVLLQKIYICKNNSRVKILFNSTTIFNLCILFQNDL